MPSECPFLSSFERSNRWLDRIIKAKFEEIVKGSQEWSDSGCLLVDIGEFLKRATVGLSQLADGVVHGEHLDIYSQQKIDGMEQNDDFSHLDTLIYLDKKSFCLKSMAVQLQSAAGKIEQTWKDSLAPPRGKNEELPIDPISKEIALNGDAISSPWASPSMHPDDAAGPANEVNSPQSDGHNQDIIDELLAGLSARGRGNYVCPFNACKKGGIRLDGQKNVFERNSDFRTHLQKHLRQHRCDFPNCRNKKGFARIDQLLRHKNTVHNR